MEYYSISLITLLAVLIGFHFGRQTKEDKPFQLPKLTKGREPDKSNPFDEASIISQAHAKDIKKRMPTV